MLLVVLWRLRYKLSLRDLAEMFLERGFVFTHETVREWEAKLAPRVADELRERRRGVVGESWYVDETYIKVDGRCCYLYRAIDRNGHLVDVRLSGSALPMMSCGTSCAQPPPATSRSHWLDAGSCSRGVSAS